MYLKTPIFYSNFSCIPGAEALRPHKGHDDVSTSLLYLEQISLCIWYLTKHFRKLFWLLTDFHYIFLNNNKISVFSINWFNSGAATIIFSLEHEESRERNRNYEYFAFPHLSSGDVQTRFQNKSVPSLAFIRGSLI